MATPRHTPMGEAGEKIPVCRCTGGRLDCSRLRQDLYGNVKVRLFNLPGGEQDSLPIFVSKVDPMIRQMLNG
jgi:hypothetical protein